MQSVKFGDDQYIFLAGSSGEALVLRAEDGELLGKRKVPNVSYQYQSYQNRRFYNQKLFGNVVSSTHTNPPPLGDVCLTKLGRKLLTWRRDDADKQNKAKLDLFDPWTQQSVWLTRKFDAGARVSLVGQEAVGVMEPDGHFVLVQLSDRAHDCRPETRCGNGAGRHLRGA